MSILFIRGINDKRTAQLIPVSNGGVNFIYDGSCGVYWNMDFASKGAEELTLFGHNMEEQHIRFNSRITVVFNEISDPDSHHGALIHCENLCNQLQLPTINHPSMILRNTRDNVSRLLQDIPGVKMPRTVRFTPRSPQDIFSGIDNTGLNFPVIVRIAGTHGGETSLLLAGRDELAKLHVYPFDGSVFYLTEFINYKSADGYYRKYRIAMVDGVPLLRHTLINPDWMVHAASVEFMQDNRHLLDEAIALRKAFNTRMLPLIRPAVEEIANRLQLDYFGIDCNIDEQGNLTIFEANANMNILLNDSPLVTDTIQEIKQHIIKLIGKKDADNQAHAPAG
ncbi:MAG: hypothetical protein WBO57_10835 [Gammaproteobacteria bacterium]